MPRLTIASSLFLKRGPLSKSILSSLHIRGSGVQVDDALLRKGWDGQQPVVTSVITVDPTTAKIRGTRYETRGAIAHVVKLKAADLWADAKEGIDVFIELDDLGIIKWVTEGDHRNLSAWIEGKDLNVTLRKGETVIQEAEKEENGVGSFVVRFTILPGDVGTSLLYAGALPCSKAELGEKLQEVGRTVDSPVIPTVALKLFKKAGKVTNGYPLVLLPAERPEDGLGLGHLPLLEVVGAQRPVFPGHDDIEEELTLFLRATIGTNNTALRPTALQALFSSPEAFPKFTSGTIPRDWPEYRGPLPRDLPAAESATGWWITLPRPSTSEGLVIPSRLEDLIALVKATWISFSNSV